jgi:hypothetical protein
MDSWQQRVYLGGAGHHGRTDGFIVWNELERSRDSDKRRKEEI